MKASIDFDKIKNDIGSLAEGSFKEYAKELKAEANKFIETTKDKLILWLQYLSEEQITRNEFMSLINSQIDLMKLEGLKEAGAAAIKLDTFKMKLINIIISAVDIIV